jgi:hypothetical protein
MGIADRDEVKELFKYPLLEAIAHRRARRFPLGCTLSEGGLQYASKQPPLPISDLETAILCWSGNGVTGSITATCPLVPGVTYSAVGLVGLLLTLLTCIM